MTINCIAYRYYHNEVAILYELANNHLVSWDHIVVRPVKRKGLLFVNNVVWKWKNMF